MDNFLFGQSLMSALLGIFDASGSYSGRFPFFSARDVLSYFTTGNNKKSIPLKDTSLHLLE